MERKRSVERQLGQLPQYHSVAAHYTMVLWLYSQPLSAGGLHSQPPRSQQQAPSAATSGHRLGGAFLSFAFAPTSSY